MITTDNRLLASAYPLVIEPIANEPVSETQRGFLHGRSFLQMIVDVDFESMKVSLTHSYGAIVLFGVATAFPNLSHD